PSIVEGSRRLPRRLPRLASPGWGSQAPEDAAGGRPPPPPPLPWAPVPAATSWLICCWMSAWLAGVVRSELGPGTGAEGTAGGGRVEQRRKRQPCGEAAAEGEGRHADVGERDAGGNEPDGRGCCASVRKNVMTRRVGVVEGVITRVGVRVAGSRVGERGLGD